MTEKSLLSMREIARELNVNYKMVVNYKNQLQELLPNRFDGYLSKYPAECVDLFRLISVLREEGYTFNMIRKVFQEADFPHDDPEIKEWVTEWICKLDATNADLGGPILTNTNQDRPARTKTDQVEPIHTGTDQQEPAHTETSLDVLVTTSPDGYEPVIPGINQSGQERSKLDPDDFLVEGRTLEQTILNKIHPTLTNLQVQLTDLTSSLPGDLVPQINAALTQFYKFAMELFARLELLEKELGLEHQPMETELDLQSMQIDQDEPTESYVHADLEFVRASIFEGKPDKESVRQWLQRERQENPGLSYATLAETLNLAGIPTLSGRDTWNRGTLRNLLTDR